MKKIYKTKTIKLGVEVSGLSGCFTPYEIQTEYYLNLTVPVADRCYDCGRIDGFHLEKKGFIKKCETHIKYIYKR